MIKRLIITIVTTYLLTQASIAQASKDAQVNCLTRAMYFEIRGGKPSEQINIGNAILNRVDHPSYPSNVCSVIADRKHGVQFPWYHQKPKITNQALYNTIKERANSLYTSFLEDSRKDTTKGAIFFHAKRVNPGWRYTRLSVPDSLHYFYKK